MDYFDLKNNSIFQTFSEGILLVGKKHTKREIGVLCRKQISTRK